MTFFQALFLGLLQGITEFLPISSSGHLVLAELLLHLQIAPADMQGINILLHSGTLLALLIVYSETWITLFKAPFTDDHDGKRKLTFLLIATIPGGLTGFLMEDWIALHFQKLLCVGLAFAVTALILLLGEACPTRSQSAWHRMLHPKEKKPEKLTTRSAFFIGFAQAAALVPGLSRSGLTISAGRMMGLKRSDALDFSFLMAVPIIAGASAMTTLDLVAGTLILPDTNIMLAAIGSSFLASFGAILFLRQFVIARSFAWFAPYLFIVSIFTVLVALAS